MSSNVSTSGPPANPVDADSPADLGGIPVFGRFRLGWDTLLTTAPIYIGLIVIWLYFDFSTGHIFHGSRNLSNLVQQYSYKPVLALGVVLVLVLGEIDLSLGYLALLSICVTAQLNANNHWSAGLSILGGVAICTLLGLAQGFLIAFVRMPAFVVTLGGFLIFEGISYIIVGGNTIRLPDASFINNLGAYYFSAGVGWALGILVALLFLSNQLLVRRARARSGLTNSPVPFVVARQAGITAVILAVVATLNNYQGLPISLVILGVLVGIFWYVTRRTPYGRHIYAVGGNQEAARRAGINTTLIRWSVFGVSGMMAGIGGVMLLGYGQAASTTTAGPDLLLDVISIAVIGGVSLTGGRGSVWSVLLGGLVLASVDSGLNLESTDPNFVYVIKGGILLAAILIDVVGKRRGGGRR